MKSSFTDKAMRALQLARKTAVSMRVNYIGTEHLLVGLLREQTGVAATVLRENGVDEEKLLSIMKEALTTNQDTAILEKDGYTPQAFHVLEESHNQAAKFGSELTGTEHILLAILRNPQCVAARLLITLRVPIKRLYASILVAMGEDVNKHKDDFPGASKDKKKEPGVLASYSRDLTLLAREGRLDPVIGRSDEIKRVIQILSRRTKNNPCLIGEAGVGKTAIVEGLAQRIVEGDVPDTVKNKRVLTLDLSGMVAGSKYRGEFEERIKRVIREVMDDGNIYLFLDELHTLIGAGGAEGAIDASNILKPSLARGEIQLIGATTVAEYRKYIEKDPALERRFQPVDVAEPTADEAVEILRGVAHKYEEHHGVQYTDEALTAAVKLSERYINDRNLPDKAIDVIDEAAAFVSLKQLEKSSGKANTKLFDELNETREEVDRALADGDFELASALHKKRNELEQELLKARSHRKNSNRPLPVVDEETVAGVVSLWTKVPLSKLAEKESDRLLKLDKVLHERVIGQEEAVSAVARAIRRGRVGLQDPNRPIGSFLFLGPTGVGKTELCKALAEAMFGDENALIRVDMSEYMESHSVSKMVGSPPGYVGFEDGGQLSDKVRRHPYSVILFDEIEKAHPDVFNILLQVLDDGHITDSKGRKVSFKNTIIIMTSNAGAQRIIDPKNLGFGAASTEQQNYERMKSGVMEEVKRIFKPEFINRIDEILVFHALGQKEMVKITTLQTSILEKRCRKQMNIDFHVRSSLKQHIVDKYTDAKMGARPIKRAVQTVIEDPLTEEILKGEIASGDVVYAAYKGGQVVFENKKKAEK